VVEIRPVTDARAVESNDATDVRKKLNAWEKKQLKETDQQKRSEQRLGDRRGGRQWGDIMERGNRRGGHDNRRERYDDRDRNDNQNRREDDQENRENQKSSSRPSESQKPKIEDIEIGEKELENASSKRKSSEGSDADHSFDDEPKKGSTDTAEPDKE